MSRASKFLTFLSVFLSFWLFAIFNYDFSDFKNILLGLPSYGLIAFGCYALHEIGKGLATLKDHEKEYISTLGDIKRANDFMLSKGIDIDLKLH